MGAALERLTEDVAAAVRDAIADAGGNEVFFLGTLSDGRVNDVRVLARGNRHAAPAILQVPRPGEVVIHNHPGGRLVPSDADIEVSSRLGNDGVGSYIVDNDVERIYVIVEPLAKPTLVPLDLDHVAQILGPDGQIASALPDYEERPQQIDMLRAVARAFNDGEVLTVEAGTGTGKSLAYLVPAILWSRANAERVIVSTHTINLQEQLVKKDLPFLIDKAGLQCRVALVKGRGNYLCLRKAAQAEAQPGELFEDELARELGDILAWSKRTKDGSLADLPVRPRPEVWEQVVAEADNCQRAGCPQYSDCFFYAARRAAAAADILVVNHHLLMADLALRDEIENYTQNAVLPPATRLIIDEAHHLEDVATTYFGMGAGLASLERVLARLRSRRNAAKGILPALQLALDSVESAADLVLAQGASGWIDSRLLPGRDSLVTQADECFAQLHGAYASLPRRSGTTEGNEKLRITSAVRESEFWRVLERELARLATAIDAYAVDFVGVIDRIEQMSEGAGTQVRYLATELAAMQSRLAAFAAGLWSFLDDGADVCRWVELRSRGRSGPALTLHGAPVDVAPLLRRTLFERFPTAVLTSATLAVDRRFDYLHERVGLVDLEVPERRTTLRVDSPFDFAEQAMLLAPHDLPEPGESSYEFAIQEAIHLAAHITGGGVFALFTSYSALNRAFGALSGELQTAGLIPIKQGDASRHVLLQRFVNSERSILFATDSFWEGVDVKGDALRCVIIARLPFRVPSEPIEEARVEEIERRGGNPFDERALPQAVIKLKQGFGRLIRSRDDRGCVLLLDSRVARRRYGKVFLDSLPPARQVIAPTREVFREMASFFGRRDSPSPRPE
jgi:ATP-dependent DNA helicase DinG